MCKKNPEQHSCFSMHMRLRSQALPIYIPRYLANMYISESTLHKVPIQHLLQVVNHSLGSSLTSILDDTLIPKVVVIWSQELNIPKVKVSLSNASPSRLTYPVNPWEWVAFIMKARLINWMLLKLFFTDVSLSHDAVLDTLKVKFNGDVWRVSESHPWDLAKLSWWPCENQVNSKTPTNNLYPTLGPAVFDLENPGGGFQPKWAKNF